MINYNIFDILGNANFSQDYFKNIPPITVVGDFKGNELIDEIWNKIKESCKNFSVDIENEITAFKYDIIMSIYTSVYSSISTKVSHGEFLTTATELVSKNPDSIKSIKANLNGIKSDLSKSYRLPTLMSGQHFDNNALLYLCNYWASDKEEFMSFDNLDFYYYLKSHKHWPFYPDNINGMPFYNYFAGIDSMREHIIRDLKESPATDKQNLNFNNIFSAYIFEELFHPINFIENVSEFLSTFNNNFHDVNNPYREQAITLLQPLFKTPPSLWKMTEKTYYSEVKGYLNNPRSIAANFSLKAHIGQVLFYKQFLYPFLQAMFCNAIYTALGGELIQVQKIIHEYINEHLQSFDYLTPLNEQVSKLDSLVFPKSRGGKVIKIKAENKEKRNNNTINSFEINFTYNHLCIPYSLNFFQKRWLYHNTDFALDNYLQDSIYQQMDALNKITNPLCTLNYIDFQSKKLYPPTP